LGIISLLAFRALPFRWFCAPCHLNPFPVDESIGNFPSGFVQIPPCSLTGDTKSLGSLFLIQPFEIDKADEFNLLRFEGDTLILYTKAAAGFVASRLPGSFNNTADARPTPPWTKAYFCFFAVRHSFISCDQLFFIRALSLCLHIFFRSQRIE
jgi:hypothetical protein